MPRGLRDFSFDPRVIQTAMGDLRDVPPPQRDLMPLPPAGASLNQMEVLRHIEKYLQVPPPWGRIFDKAASITLAAAGVNTEIVAFQVQPGFIGIWRWFGEQTGSSSDTGSVSFSGFKDGAAIPGLQGIVGLKSPGIIDPDPIAVPLFPGTRISIVATNLAGITVQNVWGRMKGWVWAPSSDL